MRYLGPAAVILFLLVSSASPELTENDANLASLEKARQRAGQVKRKVKFQKVYGNFLIFYDYTGATLVLQFKRDKWDYDLDKKVAFLRRGTSYFVDFEYWGQVVKMPARHQVNTRANLAALNTRDRNVLSLNSRGTRSIYLGQFLDFGTAVVEALRY